MLNAPEVETLFSHPLASFLSTTFPERAAPRGPYLEAEAHAETAALELRYHTYSDLSWPWSWHSSSTPREASHRTVRMHRFLTGREAGGIKPIYGLTSYVLPLHVIPSSRIANSDYLAPYSFGLPPLLTAACRTFPYRRVMNQS